MTRRWTLVIHCGGGEVPSPDPAAKISQGVKSHVPRRVRLEDSIGSTGWVAPISLHENCCDDRLNLGTTLSSGMLPVPNPVPRLPKQPFTSSTLSRTARSADSSSPRESVAPPGSVSFSSVLTKSTCPANAHPELSAVDRQRRLHGTSGNKSLAFGHGIPQVVEHNPLTCNGDLMSPRNY